MRSFKTITCQPAYTYYLWQAELQLYNLRSVEMSNTYTALVYIPKGFRKPEGWKKLEELFPEASFFYYEDTEGELANHIRETDYEPLCRIWMLQKHFSRFYKLRDSVILYMDCDVLLARKPDFSQYLGDDVVYTSTTGYLGVQYMDSKWADVKPELLEDYKKLDVLDMTARLVGIDREIATRNDHGAGGAQYLLKNVDGQFWSECFQACKKIRVFLKEVINKNYFESEDKGFQSWCADMWAVLWVLWKRGVETECPREMDFAWATDSINRLEDAAFLHNAGISSEVMMFNGKPTKFFYKNKYNKVKNIPHTQPDKLKEVDPGYCSKFYADQLLKIKSSVAA